MRSILTARASRELDQAAVSVTGLSTLVLMENAGRGAAELARSEFDCKRVLVTVGLGNNGGDGLVLARHLMLGGHEVEVFVVGDAQRIGGDARQMREAFVALGGRLDIIDGPAGLARFEEALRRATLLVDGLFGTGLSRPIEGWTAEVIRLVNESSCPVLALDLPSGLDSDQGRIYGLCVRATATVSFAHPKPAHFTSIGVEYSGRLFVTSIGISGSMTALVEPSARWFEASDARAHLGTRSLCLHKGRAGRVMVMAGARGTSGAGLLAARGALRAGAGLVTHVGTREAISELEPRVLESMTAVLDEHRLAEHLLEQVCRAQSVIVGPGLGLSETARLICRTLAKSARASVVLDADAITLLAEQPKLFESAAGPRVLLPHPVEMARLLGIDAEEVVRTPLETTRRAVELTEATVVLKGPYSVVGSPGRPLFVAGGPCPLLAVGGSGDVLSGIVAALLVDHPPLEAALLGVIVHNRTGAIHRGLTGTDRGMLAHELADHVPGAFASLAEGGKRDDSLAASSSPLAAHRPQ